MPLWGAYTAAPAGLPPLRPATRAPRSLSVAALHHSIREHGLGDLHESADVRPIHVIHIAVAGAAVLHARLVDDEHDLLQTLIDLAGGPAQSHRVLCLLQSRD